MRVAAGYIFITFLLFILHSFVVPYLAVVHVLPDLLLIWIVFIAVRRGQLAGIVAGFVIGLLLDLTGGEGEMLGLASLTKSVSGFIAGYFFNENKTFQTLGGFQFIFAVFSVSLAHHLLYFIIFLQGTGIGIGGMVLQYVVPGSLYSALMALLPMFIVSRKHGT